MPPLLEAGTTGEPGRVIRKVCRRLPHTNNTVFIGYDKNVDCLGNVVRIPTSQKRE